jgi:hypothetical protein
VAYTVPNTGLVRPFKASQNRYIHRRAKLVVGGSGIGGGTTGTAQLTVPIPGPGRLVGITYGTQNLTDSLSGAPVAPTGGALIVKAETTAGVQIFTDADISSVPTTPPVPVGGPAIDEGGAATAATDAFSGGFPVRSGVFVEITGGTDTEVILVDMWFRLCTYAKLELSSQSGADGAGAVTRTLNLGNAGTLAALAIDYQNMPNTTDILIKADNTNGTTLFTRTSSNTDVLPTLLGRPGADEGVAATAATDGTEGGYFFKRGLFFSVAEADAFTTGNEKIVVECWIDD